MTELLIYGILFLALIGHILFASKMYRVVQADNSLGMKEKNDWKLKALVFPAYYFGRYKDRNNSVK